MKLTTIITAAALALSPIAATAGVGCDTLGDVAAAIMKQRQAGTALSKMMDAASAAGSMEALIAGLTMIAYDQPRMASDAGKQRSIDDFRNAVELECYKEGGQ